MDEESDPNFWYNPEDYYDKVAEGDELRHFKHLRNVGLTTPNFRIQMKVHYPEGEITIKHEFLKPGQIVTEHIDNKCIEPMTRLINITQVVPTLTQMAKQIGGKK